ncbi:MAG: polyprenyl diphosphate synthase [Minisyncoccia bacterium]
MKENAPNCIGIILDGNRRWAKENNLPSLEGHRRGVEKLKEAALWVRDRGIRHLVVYAFSTENWNRSEEEVNYLLKLFRTVVDEFFGELAKENIRVRFAGERARPTERGQSFGREKFGKEIQDAMQRVEEVSKNNTALTLWACFSYGGRAEIVSAANSASKTGEVTEESLNKNLWTSGMPDPDIIIRTGGEKRLSGFLTWQSIYSELFFVDEYWPDFSEKILDSVLSQYSSRTRRMGK